MIAPVSRSMLNAGQPSESDSVMGIGGGWQLAYRKTEDRKKASGLQLSYLHKEGGAESRRGSITSLPVADDGDGADQAAGVY
ncbi:hypothetical protein Hanom_Chr09g00806351 [Helianthus anomalus]